MRGALRARALSPAESAALRRFPGRLQGICIQKEGARRDQTGTLCKRPSQDYLHSRMNVY